MNNFNIAIIKTNNYFINESVDIDKITKDEIKEELKKIVEIKEVNINNMMDEVVKVLKLTENHIADTSLCYEDAKVVYQLCNMRFITNENNNGKKDFNCFGTQLTTTKETIYGDSVLIKSKIKDDNLCETDTFNLDDIVDLYYSKLVHKALKVNHDGSIEEILYRKSPFEKMSKEVYENYRYINNKIFGLGLEMHIEIIPKTNKINKKMTILKGNKKVRGDVILALRTHEYNYIDIDEKLYKKLICTCYGSLKNRDLSEDESNNRKEKGNLMMVINSLCILEKRYKKYCLEKKKNLFTCKGCFRMKYSSIEEQKLDWKNHSKECLFKSKDDLNELLLNELRVMKHKSQIKENMEKNEIEDKKAVLEYN